MINQRSVGIGVTALAFCSVFAAGCFKLLFPPCNSARWVVKTLSDPDYDKVSFEPIRTTVTELRQLKPPAILPERQRLGPVEFRTYLVRAVVVGFERKRDGDWHLVIAEPEDLGQTMITEVVDPACAGAVDSPRNREFRAARKKFISLLGRPGSGWGDPGGTVRVKVATRDYMKAIGIPHVGAPLRPVPSAKRKVSGLPVGRFHPSLTVEVTGVGFFDRFHGEAGQAPNGIELHPVLSIRRAK